MLKELSNRVLWRYVCLLFALSLFVLSSCDGGDKEVESTREPSKHVEKRTWGIENVVFERLDGKSVPYAELEGKILVVNFWATWNPDSKQLFPMMNQIQNKYHRQVTVMMVAIDKGGAAPVRRFMDNQMVAYEIYVNGEETANRFGGIKTLPTTFFVLRDGKIAERIEGLKSKRNYEAVLINFLKRRM